MVADDGLDLRLDGEVERQTLSTSLIHSRKSRQTQLSVERRLSLSWITTRLQRRQHLQRNRMFALSLEMLTLERDSFRGMEMMEIERI